MEKLTDIVARTRSLDFHFYEKIIREVGQKEKLEENQDGPTNSVKNEYGGSEIAY